MSVLLDLVPQEFDMNIPPKNMLPEEWNQMRCKKAKHKEDESNGVETETRGFNER